MRFAGQYYDAESGEYYNYFRYYDASTGRYVTSDPIGLYGGLNTYGYVGGNTTRYSDPLGLLTIFIGGAADKNPFWFFGSYGPYHIVGDFADEFVEVDGNSDYFGYDEGNQILEKVKAALVSDPCEPINFVGHSYGGKTAVALARILANEGIRINLIITVDPVGGVIPGLWDDADSLSNVDTWINVDAVHGAWDRSDWIAFWGSKWDSTVDGESDLFQTITAHHREFEKLLKTKKKFSAYEKLLELKDKSKYNCN